MKKEVDAMSAISQWTVLLSSLPETEEDRMRQQREADADAEAAVLDAHQRAAAAQNADRTGRRRTETARTLPDDDGEDSDDSAAETKRAQEAIEERALANVKPFLLALFDEGPLASEYDPQSDQRTAELVSRQLVPGSGYRETLRRELAKPQVLSYCLSTDRVPLTTRTAPPTFSSYSAPCETPECPLSLFGVTVHSTSRFHREATTVEGFPGGTRLDSTTAATLQKIREARQRMAHDPAPYHGVHYDERRELQDAHLQDLLTTINRARAQPVERRPWIGGARR